MESHLRFPCLAQKLCIPVYAIGTCAELCCTSAQVHVAFNGTAYNNLGLPSLPVEPVQFWRLPSDVDTALQAGDPSTPADFPAMAPMPSRLALP